jgi:hypothetical protein
MSSAIDITLIVIGSLLIAGSRMFADYFRVPGNSSAFIKFAGLGDNYNSRLYRWVTAVATGGAFIVVGIADLMS